MMMYGSRTGDAMQDPSITRCAQHVTFEREPRRSCWATGSGPTADSYPSACAKSAPGPLELCDDHYREIVGERS